MSFKCKIGLHSWDGCKCSECNKEKHNWLKYKCTNCGKLQLFKCEICSNYFPPLRKKDINSFSNVLISDVTRVVKCDQCGHIVCAGCEGFSYTCQKCGRDGYTHF